MTVTKKQIIEKLKEIIDPELGINIVDLGLIYEVNVHKAKKGENQKAEVKVTFTTPACPLATYLFGSIESKLNELQNLDVEVSVVFEPPWTPEKMSERAKIKLGMK